MLRATALVVVLLSVTAAVLANVATCPVVKDGLAGEDLSLQTSRTTIAASWTGFENNNVILYEWGVISSELFTAAKLDASRCGDVLPVVPDVRDWAIVRNVAHAVDTQVQLQAHETYHVVLRVTFNTGMQTVAVSDGVRVVAPQDVLSLVGDNAEQHQRNARVHTDTEAVEGNEAKKRAHLINPVGVCPLDNANRCRQSQRNVGDFLRETYGPPVFNRDGPVTNLFRIGNPEDRVAAGLSAEASDDDDDGDDDDGGGVPAWVLAPILIFLLLLALLVLLILGVLMFLRRGDDSPRAAPFKATVQNEKDEGYAQGRDKISAGGTDDTTKVEFPETDIRRLSITHNEAPNLDEMNDATSPRKKAQHPIMQTASSSFRDYKNA